VVSFTHVPPGIELPVPSELERGGPQSRSGRYGEENYLACVGKRTPTPVKMEKMLLLAIFVLLENVSDSCKSSINIQGGSELLLLWLYNPLFGLGRFF
jgi:hypothetical protein